MNKILKELRLQNNITQKEIADYLHISQSLYCRYENGERNLNIYIIEKLADYYKITIDELFGR